MKKPTRITYFFGAGASIGNTKSWIENSLKTDRKLKELFELSNGMPITEDLNRFREMFNHIVEKESFDFVDESNHHGVIVKQIGELLIDLEKAFISQLSPDTYGRALRIAHKYGEYKAFKNSLAFFVNLIDSITYPDKRYSNLLSNFIDIESSYVPENINFFTYNFDAAAEKSLIPFWPEEMSSQLNLEEIRNKYKILTETNINPSSDYSKSSVWLKLHGAASDLIGKKTYRYLLEIDDYRFKNSSLIKVPNPNLQGLEPKKKRVVEAFDAVAEIRKKLSESEVSSIRFAWDIQEDDPLMKVALDKLKETEILVVVGYTFPAFNQRNDLKMLRALSHGGFDKIIIQLPEGGGAEVRKRVLEMFKNLATPIPESKVELVTDCTAFHIPVEYFSNEKIIHETSEPFFG
jgi:hypothetical protein